MKKVIIGIHGLENKPSKRLLTEWWKHSMEEGLVAIGKYRELPVFELVYWADAVYDKPLDPDITDKNDPYYLDEFYTPATIGYQPQIHEFRVKAVGLAAKLLKRIFLNEDFSMKNSSVARNIVQRYFHELDIYYRDYGNDEDCPACKARKTMIDRVVSILNQYRNDQILLIGHSMGSILAFDAICFYVPEIRIDTFITIGSPLGLPLVLSKIAERQNAARDDKSSIQTPASIDRRWYNFSDIEDVVAINYKLNEDFSPNRNGVNPIDRLVKNNYLMNGRKNPHSVFGYLRSTAMSEVLSAFIEEEEPKLSAKVFGTLKKAWKNVRMAFSGKEK